MDALRDIVSKCTSANKRGWFFGLGPEGKQAFIKELCETGSDYQTLLGKYRGRLPVPPHVLNATDRSGAKVSNRLLGYLKSKQQETDRKKPKQSYPRQPIKTYGASQVQPHSTKTSQLQPHSTKTSQLQPHSTKTSQLQPHSTKTSQVQPHSTKTSQLQPHSTKTSQVQPHSTKTSQLQPHSTKTSQLQPHITKTSQVQPHITKTSQECPIKTNMVSSSKLNSISSYYEKLLNTPLKELVATLKKIILQSPVDDKSIIYNAKKYITKNSITFDKPLNISYVTLKTGIEKCNQVRHKCTNDDEYYLQKYLPSSSKKINKLYGKFNLDTNTEDLIQKYQYSKFENDYDDLLDKIEEAYKNKNISFKNKITQQEINKCIKEEGSGICNIYDDYLKKIDYIKTVCGADNIKYIIKDTDVGKIYEVGPKHSICNHVVKNIYKSIPNVVFKDIATSSHPLYKESIHIYAYWPKNKNVSEQKYKTVENIKKIAKKYNRTVCDYSNQNYVDNDFEFIKDVIKNKSEHVILLNIWISGGRPFHHRLIYNITSGATVKLLSNTITLFKFQPGIHIAEVLTKVDQKYDNNAIVNIMNNILTCYPNKDMIEILAKAL